MKSPSDNRNLGKDDAGRKHDIPTLVCSTALAAAAVGTHRRNCLPRPRTAPRIPHSGHAFSLRRDFMPGTAACRSQRHVERRRSGLGGWGSRCRRRMRSGRRCGLRSRSSCRRIGSGLGGGRRAGGVSSGFRLSSGRGRRGIRGLGAIGRQRRRMSAGGSRSRTACRCSCHAVKHGTVAEQEETQHRRQDFAHCSNPS